MVKTLVKGSLAGGMALFLWGMVSWMCLPWHDAVIGQLAREDLFTAVLEEAVPSSGVYLYPNEGGKKMTAEEEKAAWEKMAKGPMVFLSVRKEGMAGMGAPMARALILQALLALLLTGLLLHAPALGLQGRVLFGAGAMLLGGAAAHGASWNWFGFPGAYTLVMLADMAVGGALAGLAAHWALRRPAGK